MNYYAEASKMKFFSTNRSKFDKFEYFNVIYLKRKLTTLQYKFKKKKHDSFLELDFYWTFLFSFPNFENEYPK